MPLSAPHPDMAVGVRLSWIGTIGRDALCSFSGAKLHGSAILPASFVHATICRIDRGGDSPRCAGPKPIASDRLSRNLKWCLTPTAPDRCAASHRCRASYPNRDPPACPTQRQLRSTQPAQTKSPASSHRRGHLSGSKRAGFTRLFLPFVLLSSRRRWPDQPSSSQDAPCRDRQSPAASRTLPDLPSIRPKGGSGGGFRSG
jgi:hypothetical protein